MPVYSLLVKLILFMKSYIDRQKERIKKVVIKKMYDWVLLNFGSFDNFILFLLAVGLLIVISLMFAALRLTFHDDIETEDKNNERFR